MAVNGSSGMPDSCRSHEAVLRQKPGRLPKQAAVLDLKRGGRGGDAESGRRISRVEVRQPGEIRAGERARHEPGIREDIRIRGNFRIRKNGIRRKGRGAVPAVRLLLRSGERGRFRGNGAVRHVVIGVAALLAV